MSSTKDLMNVIVPHFIKYPLLTQKRADFELFRMIVELLNKKEHLTPEGLQQIVNIRASINLGLSDVLKAAFPNTEPVLRPLVEVQENIDGHWLAGFVDGEGCFDVKMANFTFPGTSKERIQISLRFIIAQHIRDEQLMKCLVKYLACGQVSVQSGGSGVYFVVAKFSDIKDKIIPFFDTYPIWGSKAMDLMDFCKVSELIKEKALASRLTKEGTEQIREIKSGMNTGRKN